MNISNKSRGHFIGHGSQNVGANLVKSSVPGAGEQARVFPVILTLRSRIILVYL